MERDVLRLECLKLATQRTPDHTEGLLRAEEYFKFVTKSDETEKLAVKVEEQTAEVKPDEKIVETKPGKKSKVENVKSLV